MLIHQFLYLWVIFHSFVSSAEGKFLLGCWNPNFGSWKVHPKPPKPAAPFLLAASPSLARVGNHHPLGHGAKALHAWTPGAEGSRVQLHLSLKNKTMVNPLFLWSFSIARWKITRRSGESPQMARHIGYFRDLQKSRLIMLVNHLPWKTYGKDLYFLI